VESRVGRAAVSCRPAFALLAERAAQYAPERSEEIAALVRRLRELGWIENRTIEDWGPMMSPSNSPGDGFCHDSAKAFAILFDCGRGRGRGLNCFQHAGLLLR
jgi:hypothetical protein